MGSRLALALSAIVSTALFAAACGPSVGGGGDGGGTGIDAPPGTIDAHPRIDATPYVDSAIAYPDAEPYGDGGACTDWTCTNPVDDGCNPPGAEICGNGLDEDCDGLPDDGCPCQAGAVQSCFRGPPGRRGVGSCVDGQQTCEGSGEFRAWGPCTGGIVPSTDACDTQDNDCNGCADDNPACCTVSLACPGPGDMPDGQPFTDYVIDGTAFYGGAVTSWRWTVSGGPCDRLFQSQGLLFLSYTLAGANTSHLTFHPTLSGDYTVHVVIQAADGNVYECTFIVHVGGPGLRVELCSDHTADTDLDLHVHRPGTTTPWAYTSTTDTTNRNPDDCHWWNCTGGASAAIPAWGNANSPLAQCQGGPEGISWILLGYCRNPRLDIDSIDEVGRPENINVDNPVNGASYRVMVNYYSGTAVAHPMVNVYCGGYLKATYGQTPDVVTGYDTSGADTTGDQWRVVDVAPAVNGAGTTTDCTLTPIHPPGQTTGYYVTTGNRAYN